MHEIVQVRDRAGWLEEDYDEQEENHLEDMLGKSCQGLDARSEQRCQSEKQGEGRR